MPLPVLVERYQFHMAAEDKSQSDEDARQSAESPSEEPKETAQPEAEASPGPLEQGAAPESPAKDGESKGPSLQDIISAQKVSLQKEPQEKGRPVAATGPAGQTEQQPAESSGAPAQVAGGAKAVCGGDGANGSGSRHRRFPVAQAALLVNMVLLILLVAVQFSMMRRHSGIPSSVVAEDLLPPPEAEVAPEVDGSQEPPSAVSLKMAEEALAAKNYAKAAGFYRRLLENSRSAPAQGIVGDFFELRLAQCLRHLGKVAEARESLDRLARSDSPVLGGAAEYYSALIDASGGRYMRARMKAYKALASLGALEEPSPLEKDCEFLVARVLTEKVLSFHESQPPIQWDAAWPADPFAGLDESALSRLLKDGLEGSSKGSIGAVVSELPNAAPGHRWVASARQLPLEEVLHKFASEMDIDVRWVSVDGLARRRSLNLFASGSSQQRLGEVACGAVGLLARFTGDEIVVHNPQFLASLAEQRELLYREGVSAWRRFFLRASGDQRIGRGHFALARLHECSGETAGAMREYRFVAKRFPRDRAAPSALLRIAGIRIRLRDYTGAREDLLEVLNGYPDSELSEQTYLSLGRVTMKAGLYEESIKLFRKLYFLDLSPRSRREACLSAGRCLYQEGDYTAAAKWLIRRVNLPGRAADGGLCEAYLLLGKSRAAQGKLTEAVGAFNRSLGSGPSKAQHVEIVLALARVQIEMQRFTGAVGALTGIGNKPFTPEQRCRYLLLLSRAYRMMGLPDKAAAVLRREIASISDARGGVEIEVELAKCYVASGDLSAARLLLTAVMPKAAPGEVAGGVKCELADVCLKMEKPGQALTIASEVLKSSCPVPMRQRALNIMGRAYLLQRDYEKAALAFSGMPPKQQGAPKQ